MPDSFLTSSHIPTPFARGSAQAVNSSRVGTPTPVYKPAPTFADVHFGTIGKQPNLLSRISAPIPAKDVYRSLSPATSPPLPTVPHDHAADSRKLVERIQLDPSGQNFLTQSSSVAHQVPATSRMNPHHLNPSVPLSNLISPIETLETASESNLPSSDSQLPPLQQIQIPENGSPSHNITETSASDSLYPDTVPNIEQSNFDGPSSNPSRSSILDPSAISLQPTQDPDSLMITAPPLEFTLSQVPGVITAEASWQVAQDTLTSIHAKLRAKRDVLASLALPTLRSRSRSPSPLITPSGISESAASVCTEMNTEDNAIVLRHPYPQNDSTSSDHSCRELPSNNGNMLAPASSQTPGLPASRNAHFSSLVEAMKRLQTAASTAVQLQLDVDRAFESERIEFEKCRKEFEERMLAREAEHQSRMQAVRKQLDELHSREQKLVALEEESRLREETRRARETECRTRDNKRKLEDESRRKAIYEEIADALPVLEEAKVEKQLWQEEKERLERERAIIQANVSPLQFPIWPRIEKEAGMTEEEVNMVDKYDTCLVHVGHLSAKLQPLLAGTRQLFDSLQHMKKKRLQTVDAGRLIADEAESLRASAEAMQSAQAEPDQERACAEAGKKDFQAKKAVIGNEEQDHLLDKQASQQPSSVTRETLMQADPIQQQPQGPLDAAAECSMLRDQVVVNKQKAAITSETTTGTERTGLQALSTAHSDDTNYSDIDMEVDELDPSPVGSTIPLPCKKGRSHRKRISMTQKIAHSQGTSGNVMLGMPSTTTSLLFDAPPPSTPSAMTLSESASYKTPSFVSASTKAGRQVITDAPLYPTEFASELNLRTSPPPNGSAPSTNCTPFPTTPKSQAVFTSHINKFPIPSDLSPAHRDANLRYIKSRRLKRNSGEGHVKRDDVGFPVATIKTEEVNMCVSERTDNASREGPSQPMDAMNAVQNDPAQVILNPRGSHKSDSPPISTKPDQVLNGFSHADTVECYPSRSILRLTTSPINPDPSVIDNIMERQGWTGTPVLPRSEPSDLAYPYSSERDSRHDCQTSAQIPSPESFTYRQRQRNHPDHHSPPPVLPTSPCRPTTRRDRFRAAVQPVYPRSKNASSRKRPAESDSEDDSDNHSRRRLRGDHYEPEPDRDYRNVQLGMRHSPTAGRRVGYSISPESYSYQPRSLGRRIEYSPTIPERRGIRNEGSYRPDPTSVVDSFQRPPDAGYTTEDHASPDEPREVIALLERISSVPTSARRTNTVRGKARGRGDSGRGRRGRSQAQSRSRPLRERIEE